ncbi:hypothetical protein QO010_003790 [Caulobacter ginsengisoli]|uniref:Uncharacterized protein n=1 Tax=Caulobacter ginsengisoli TaxID=400775 RepID=A0ABU0IVF9_9CAUL|nr:hypothetical protein [Caulobacter ginsengisoli]MDQ0465997.1 hypothetical protein [Caulobacter ginsengisoli]
MHPSELQLAHIRHEPGYEGGLCYQVSADRDRFPSLIWGDPFVLLLSGALSLAHPRFDLYGVCEMPAQAWIGVARAAEETEDRLRAERSIPADLLYRSGELLADGEISRLLRSAAGRGRVFDALQLTSFWLREAAGQHPTLTFFGA